MELKPINMFLLENRLQTFKGWIYENKAVNCTAEKMAQAGFYMLNENDSAKCFICLKTLDGWEAEDDPWEEHKKHANYCPFILLNKREDELIISDIVDLFEKMMINLRTESYSGQVKKLNDLQDQMISSLKANEKKKKKKNDCEELSPMDNM